MADNSRPILRSACPILCACASDIVVWQIRRQTHRKHVNFRFLPLKYLIAVAGLGF